MANAMSLADARLSEASSPGAGVPRPSGPVEPLLELQATLPLGVAPLSRRGRVRDMEEREYRTLCARAEFGRCG